MQGHLIASKEKKEFAAQDENGLSCAVEAVGIASGKKYCLSLYFSFFFLLHSVSLSVGYHLFANRRFVYCPE